MVYFTYTLDPIKIHHLWIGKCSVHPMDGLGFSFWWHPGKKLGPPPKSSQGCLCTNDCTNKGRVMCGRDVFLFLIMIGDVGKKSIKSFHILEVAAYGCLSCASEIDVQKKHQ